jgi:hypothetical protein
MGHHVRERMSGLDDARSMLVEEFEKIAFSWQQLGKQHQEFPESKFK